MRQAARERDERWQSNGILGIKLGMTQVFAEDGYAGGLHRVCRLVPAWWCSGAPRKKTATTPRNSGLVEFVKPQRVNKPMTGHFKKADVAPMQVSARNPLEESAGRNQGRRPRAGREFQARRACRRHRHQQGQGFCGRRQALALRRRRRHARFDVPPRAGRHWRQFVSLARVEGPAFPGAHGQRARDREESESGEGGQRRESAAGSRFGAGSQGNVHLDPKIRKTIKAK